MTLSTKDLDRLQSERKIRGYTETFKAKEKKNKYGAKKVEIDGKTFDSKKEASRYLELRMLERAGIITGLETQVSYLLIEKNGKERECRYKCDFRYYRDGVQIIEDVKSNVTRKLSTYIMKRKLMLEKYSITILET